ncbi:MAG TPA: cytochrome P450 [Ktedonobacter sp.]|nr:cytochrome P450 [Ktedonobacter sp.]
MTSPEKAYSIQSHEENDVKAGEARCPVDHSALSHQKTSHGAVVRASEKPFERDEQGVWHIYGFDEARTVLRSSVTKQAGFNAEMIESVPGTTNRPILYLEGKEHNQQRKQTARFFTPKTVSSDYRAFMEKLSDQLIRKLKRKKRADLSDLSLKLAVQVAAQVVGTTNSIFPGMGLRLNSFFEGGEVSEETNPVRKLFSRIYHSLQQSNVMLFFMLDVKPSIRVRRRKAQEDVISHLLSLNYNEAEILTECVTYAAAGMVTTREFISVAAWHFLEHPELRARYLTAPEEERIEMLHETLRLEPIVRNLQRRATDDIEIENQGKHATIQKGDLINIDIHAANMDETVVGEEPYALCPMRPLHGDRVPSMVMSFGDGPHRCPGAYIAIQETDIFLQRLLALDTLHIERTPTIKWNDLTTGYEIRDFQKNG